MSEETFRKYKFQYANSYSDSVLIDSFEKVIESNAILADSVVSSEETIQNILQNEEYIRLRNFQHLKTPIFVTIFSSQLLLNNTSCNFFIMVSPTQNIHSDNTRNYLFSLKEKNGKWSLKILQYY